MAKRLFDYENEENIDLFMVIKSADVRVAKNGKKFIAFTFQDASGHITGKYWDASDDDVAQFTAGQVIHLTGKRELYQNNPQVKIYKIRLATEADGVEASQFMEHAPESRAELEADLNQFVFEITNANWNRIVRYLLKKFKDRFYEYPAAKTNHHAYAGGLAFHTLSILRLGKSVCAQYDFLNSSLLYAGTILHDLGKTIELSGPASTTYTLAGNLVGHIVLIDEEIAEAARALDIDLSQEDMVVLRHVVLAHHGQLEYGSPVRPAIIEGEVLHDLDELDATMNMLQTSLKHAQPGTFTERIFGLDNRAFYRPKFENTTLDNQE